jgi:AcrR family transcriptional regulator
MTTAARPSPARERLLATASQLFYAEGIGNVGVSRIVAESHVTLATFYRHFPSKQDLVVAYLRGIHDQEVAWSDEMSTRLRGRELLNAIRDFVVSQISDPAFRACAFTNAASEIEAADSPIRHVVTEHRAWYHGLLRTGFAQSGHPQPSIAARQFLALRDGAMTAGYLDSRATAKRTFRQGVDDLIGSIDRESLSAPSPVDGDGGDDTGPA